MENLEITTDVKIEDFETYLVAKTPAEKQIKNYVLGVATDELKLKIMKSNKNISDCLNWISGEVKKGSGSCYVASDDEVYGLAIHYFEEASIKANSRPKTANIKTSNDVEIKPSKYEKEKIKAEKKKQKEEQEHTPNLFDILGE